MTAPIHLDTSSGSPENCEGVEILISGVLPVPVPDILGLLIGGGLVRARVAKVLAVIFRGVRGSWMSSEDRLDSVGLPSASDSAAER